MALIDKASLLFVPSVVAEGKAFNILPSGNRAPDSTDQNSGYDQTRADFDFDRGTDHAATRIGSDGLIKKYRENLLVRSNQFDTTWGNNNTTETSGQADKDGGTNAWLINSTSSFGSVIQGISSVSGVYTLSVYAKAGTNNWMLLRMLGSSNSRAWFDLENGVLGSTDGPTIQSKIESVGGGWYRCSVTGNMTSFSQVLVYPTNANLVVGAAGNILIQSAQLETGLVATDYLESTSVTGKAGVLVDMPRINFDANGENGSLLLEPSRKNSIQYSEYYAGYPQTRITLTHNATTSPEGVDNATKMVETTDNGLHFLALTGDVTSSANAAFSIFAKQGENQFLQVLFGTGQTSPQAYANIDLSDGTYNDYNMVSFDTEDYGNGWYRIFGVVNSLATSLGFYIASVQSKTASRAATYTGDGTSGFYIYGAMLEGSASYQSSYIPNHGESGGVTRAADSCSVTGVSDVIGQTEGTIFAEFDFHAYAGAIDRGLFSVAESGQGYVDAIYVSSYNNDLYFAIFNGGVGQVNIAKSNISIGKHKIAIAYKANDFAYYLDGVQIGIDSSGSLPSPLNFVGIGNINGGFLGDFDTTEFTLFKERLSNAELATLTTL